MPFPLAESLASDFGVDRAAESPGLFVPGSAPGEGGGRAAERAERARGMPATLPCQYSNNSDKEPSKLTSYQRKNAHSINENLAHLVGIFGVARIGFLTLTFPKDLTLKEANRRLNSLARRFLDAHFITWVCVREFTKGGRPHFHLVVVCREDIRTGFNFENLTRLAWLTARPERRRKHALEIKSLSRSLSPCFALKALWAELRRVLPLYQFGRHELAPVRKTGAALARYVGGYIRKSMDFRPAEAKGARMVTYARSFPRKVVGHAWSFNTEGARFWRMKVAAFAAIHRVKDLDVMAKRYGPRWAWWLRDLIESINLIPILGSDQMGSYVNGRDNESVNEAVMLGVSVLALHLYRPRLPEVDGVPVHPPARLRAVFGFHLANWDKSRDLIAHESVALRRRMAGVQRFHTDETIAAARAALLAAPKYSPAEIRARNYQRLHFRDPSYET